MHRAYHALPKLTTNAGEPINAVYGLTSMLLRLVEDLKPTHIAVCFDRKEPTFRKKEFKDYQAHRPETEKELSSQFEKAKEVLTSMKINYFEKPGYEADDLLATISSQATENLKLKTKKKSSVLGIKTSFVDEVIIVTGDRDILQLVDDAKNIAVYMPVTGLSKSKMYREKDVYEALNVSPRQVIDYKALVGDASDNYPGVSGIGPKTAVKLIDLYGDYKNIFKNLSNVDEKTKKKLSEGKEGGDISYKLAKIVTDVSIKFDLNELDDWEIGSKENVELFESFGFKTLTKRVKKFGISEEPVYRNNLSKVEIESTALKLVGMLGNGQYAIRGTAGLKLQGFDMAADDIDILCDKETAISCNEVFKEYLLQEVKYRESDQYKSYFGKFVVDSVLVEVCGEWQIRVEEPQTRTSSVRSKHEGKRVKENWSKTFNASDEDVDEIDILGTKVRVTKPEHELKVFALEGRWNAYHKLKRFAEERNQGILFKF